MVFGGLASVLQIPLCLQPAEIASDSSFYQLCARCSESFSGKN